jgi:hypothetical protein
MHCGTIATVAAVVPQSENLKEHYCACVGIRCFLHTPVWWQRLEPSGPSWPLVKHFCKTEPIGDRPWHTALRQMRDSHPLSTPMDRAACSVRPNSTIVSFSFSSLSPVTALSSDSIDDPNPHALSKLGSCRGAPAGFARQPIERAGVPGSALPTALASSCSRCARQDCCSKEAKA